MTFQRDPDNPLQVITEKHSGEFWPWVFFSPDEMACPHCGKLKINVGLMDRLELLRATLGRPLRVNSGYRSPEYNLAVGGAENSYHMRGEAVDLHCTSIRERMQLLTMGCRLGFNGFGLYQTHVHLDLGAFRHWYSSRLADET